MIKSTSSKTTSNPNLTTTTWKGGYVTDNYETYYLDENMVKHPQKPTSTTCERNEPYEDLKNEITW